MANVKISQLPSASLPLTGSEIFPLVQSGVTVKSAINSIYPTTGSIATLRGISPANYNNIYMEGYYSLGDGGEGYFYSATGFPAGHYVDNGGTIIVPTGGDGSSAWLRIFDQINVKMFGAKGDAGTDDADAFQRAINYAQSIGGTAVYVPAVNIGFKLASQIWVKSDVSLIGASSLQDVTTGGTSISQYYGGSCLIIDWGANSAGTPNSTTACAIRMSVASNISGLNFIYPGQITSALTSTPIVFPPTISAYDNDCPTGSIENCFFVNSYKAIYFVATHYALNITNVWGQIISAFITINGCLAADQISGVNAAGTYYLGGGANLADNSSFLAWVQNNGVAYDIGYADSIRFTDCFASFCNKGLKFGNAPTSISTASLDQFAYGNWTGGAIDDTTFPIYVDGSTSSGLARYVFKVTNAGITAFGHFNTTSRCVSMYQPTTTYDATLEYRGKLVFSNCAFWGAGSTTANTGVLEGVVDATGSDVEFHGCTFRPAFETYYMRSYSGTPVIKIYNCTFEEISAAFTPLVVTFMNYNAASSGRIIQIGCTFLNGPTYNIAVSSSTYVTGYAPIFIPSASALSLIDYGDYTTLYKVTGTTGINGITPRPANTLATLVFEGIVSITNGVNLYLSAPYTTSANDTLTVISDGYNWYEIARSVNRN